MKKTKSKKNKLKGLMQQEPPKEPENLNQEDQVEDLNQIFQSTIDKNSPEALASLVIAYKALGLNRDLAFLAMQEIANRQSTGDAFDYDSFIMKELEKIPKINSMDYNSIFMMLKK